MNHSKKISARLIKAIIALLAVFNLIALFAFEYRLPGRITRLFSSDAPSSANIGTPADSPDSAETSASAASGWTIRVPQEALSYDGTGALDLNAGVSVIDSEGSAVDSVKVVASILPGETSASRTIEYAVTDENNIRVTASRALTLPESYTGPSITPESKPSPLSSDALDAASILKSLSEDHAFRAQDGFGNDVTDQVKAELSGDPDQDGNASVKLTLTNAIGDSASQSISVSVGINGPMLTLTTDKVTLKKGERFNYLNYIDKAVDADGTSLSRYIRMNGSVNTSAAGTYELEFFCTNSSGEKSPVKKLTVVIE